MENYQRREAYPGEKGGEPAGWRNDYFLPRVILLLKADRSMPDNAVTLDYVVDSLVTCGTVNSVVDQLLAFRERIGDSARCSMPATTGSIPRSLNARWN